MNNGKQVQAYAFPLTAEEHAELLRRYREYERACGEAMSLPAALVRALGEATAAREGRA